MRKYLRLHRIFIAQDLKKLMEYKVDFLMGAIGFVLVQAVKILTLGIMFAAIPALVYKVNGVVLDSWTFNEVLFIYGFSLIPKGIDHLLFDNLWGMGYWVVAKGDFDKYLTRPVNSWFYVLTEKFCVDAFGDLFVGIVLVIYSVFSMPAEIAANINWLRLIPVALVMPFAIMIYTSVKTGTAAISFWTKRSGHITHMCYMTNEFASYPAKIYNSVIKTIITYILPFALTAYYPAIYILRGESPWSLAVTVGVSVALFLISQLVWMLGVKSYESAGS
ncbi:MAG: ABC-2 family transporter protein [Clostridia bacterium]|nr:ABC-2 family transporter protein [Clostridia bacterium]